MRAFVHHSSTLAVVLCACSSTSNPDPEPTGPDRIVIEGFSTPESVLHDPEADVYLVSNISGAPGAADDDGFISRVSPDGTITELRWIDGKRDDVELSAPKGSGIVGDTLFVTDITFVRRFDRISGAPRGSITVAGASFLNDIAVGPSGVVWVSDNAEGKIHRIPDPNADAIETVVELDGVNGLAVDAAGEVWALADGRLYSIDPSQVVERQALPKTGLDGLVILADGRFLISSWEANAVFIGKPGGSFEILFDQIEAPADIGFDGGRRRVLIPQFEGDRVIVRALP